MKQNKIAVKYYYKALVTFFLLFQAGFGLFSWSQEVEQKFDLKLDSRIDQLDLLLLNKFLKACPVKIIYVIKVAASYHILL